MNRDEAKLLLQKHSEGAVGYVWTSHEKDVICAAILEAANVVELDAKPGQDDAELDMAIGYFVDTGPPATFAGAIERISNMQDTFRRVHDRIAALSAQALKLRKILAHVPARIALEAKEAAGYGEYVADAAIAAKPSAEG